MPDLEDFHRGVPTALEGQQHRLLWAKHLIAEHEREASRLQREAWRFWLTIVLPIGTAAMTLGTLLWGWVHGGHP